MIELGCCEEIFVEVCVEVVDKVIVVGVKLFIVLIIDFDEVFILYLLGNVMCICVKVVGDFDMGV